MRHSKFDRSRLVPVSDHHRDAFCSYAQMRDRLLPSARSLTREPVHVTPALTCYFVVGLGRFELPTS